METSLKLVKNLQKKKAENETLMPRYSLADDVYGKAELDLDQGIVNLWLGANVMLEFTYAEALDFLGQQLTKASQESKDTVEDMGTVRDQIVTCEVSISRIFNWSVRRKRAAEAKA